MQQHWFHTVWPFAGGGAAIVMVAILLTTDTFRATKGSRWRDPVWLAWLAAPLYWVHGYMRTAAPVVVALASILAACGSGTTSPSAPPSRTTDTVDHYELVFLASTRRVTNIIPLSSCHSPPAAATSCER